MIRLLHFICIACISVIPVGAASLSGMQAGVASTVITPTLPMFLSGYASRNQPAVGMINELKCKALALGDAHGNRAVILTCDLLGVSRELSDSVAAQIEAQTGLERRSVLLAASHTHYGPVVQGILEPNEILPAAQVRLSKDYTAHLERQMVDLAVRALKTMEPAHFSFGTGEATFAVNRREFTLDGVRIGVNPIGPVDHSVPVLRILDDDYRIKAVLFGYACHNTTIPADDYRYTGDWAGLAQDELERLYPGCTAVFLTGCAGDSNPHPRRRVELAQHHANELVESVQAVLTGTMTPIGGALQTTFREIELPFASVPDRETVEAQLAVIHPFQQVRALRMMRVLDRGEALPEAHPYPVQTIMLGDAFTLIALGGEVVADYALLLKHQHGESIWVAAYANDVAGYVPSLRVLREGGYEPVNSTIYYGLQAPWAEEVETIILEEVARQVGEMK